MACIGIVYRWHARTHDESKFCIYIYIRNSFFKNAKQQKMLPTSY